MIDWYRYVGKGLCLQIKLHLSQNRGRIAHFSTVNIYHNDYHFISTWAYIVISVIKLDRTSTGHGCVHN